MGTVAKVMQDGDKFELYIQVAPEEEVPSWVKFSLFLEESLARFAEDQNFINNCLQLFHDQQHTDISKVEETIKN